MKAPQAANNALKMCVYTCVVCTRVYSVYSILDYLYTSWNFGSQFWHRRYRNKWSCFRKEEASALNSMHGCAEFKETAPQTSAWSFHTSAHMSTRCAITSSSGGCTREIWSKIQSQSWHVDALSSCATLNMGLVCVCVFARARVNNKRVHCWDSSCRESVLAAASGGVATVCQPRTTGPPHAMKHTACDRRDDLSHVLIQALTPVHLHVRSRWRRWVWACGCGCITFARLYLCVS